MLDIADRLLTLPVAIILLILLVVATYAIIIIGRRWRIKRLLDAGADPEFIALLNDRHAFCDSEAEYKALLDREANNPPPAVEGDRSEPVSAMEGRNVWR